MSHKTEKPVLSGQRIKTRKRDEKEKYDPAGFRDSIILGLDKTGPDVDAIFKFLDTAGSILHYRRYGEALFDILIAGGLLGLYYILFYVCSKTYYGNVKIQFMNFCCKIFKHRLPSNNKKLRLLCL